MGIYCVYSGTDSESYLCELQIAGTGPALDQLLPCRGWRPFQHVGGGSRPAHPTPVAGMTVILEGHMEIGVAGGSRRQLRLQPGDMLLVLDTSGRGHSTSIPATDRLRVAGVAFDSGDWPKVRAAFTDWPPQMMPP
jgi:hypothetical protein